MCLLSQMTARRFLPSMKWSGKGRRGLSPGGLRKRGFRTAIIERRFTSDFRVGEDDPAVALCGVDNGLARRALEDVGFGRIIEAGLGQGIRDFLGFRTHLLPGSRRARDIWPPDEEDPEIRIDLPAYQAMEATGADRCGLTQIAGRTVGAPFVGAIAVKP